jgi:DNA-binding MarR family transcriptional regulator
MNDSNHLGATILDQAVRIGRLVRSGRRAGPLNDVQWETLRFLGRANLLSRNPAGIAAWLGVTRGLASQTVDALARRGLILRLPDPRDGRGLALELTQAGYRMAATDPIGAAIAAVGSLPGKDAAAAGAMLAAALSALERAGAATAFGHCHGCRHFRPDQAPGETGGPHRCDRAEVPVNDAETQRLCALFSAKDAPAA